MAMRIGGWHRLWIVIGVVYLPIVAVIAWSTRPMPTSISHDAALYSRLSSELRSRILNSQVDPAKEQAFIEDAEQVKDVEIVEMPNGHFLVFRKTLPRAESEAAAGAYWNEVDREVKNKRIEHFLSALVWWLIPVISLYGLGWSIGWIYQGFKKA